MNQSQELAITGLRTNPSPQAAKGGSLAVADNVNIDSPNTATSRRGFDKYRTALTLGGNRVDAIAEFQDTLLVHYGNTLARDNGSGWTDYSGTYVNADLDIGFRSIQANGAFYFATTAGVKKLDSVTGNIAEAGVPKAINCDLTAVDSGTAVLVNNQVAYRILWGYRDANNKVILGTPSERVTFTRASGAGSTANVTLKIYIPDGISTDYFFQIYRSSGSGSDAVIANDELGIVYEGNITSTNITNGYVEVTDIAPDALRGATIYTAPSQEGSLATNDQPPLCKDMARYKDCILYANCKSRHRLQLTLIAIGGTLGLAAGDVLYINGDTYTGVSGTPTYTSGQFKVYTSGTLAQNIEDTAIDFVKAINLKTSNTEVYAYYTSGYDELPGKFVIERRDLTDTAFYAYIDTAASAQDHGPAFNPELPDKIVDSGSLTDVASDNDDKPNRIYVSKRNEPDAVPTVNYFDCGTDTADIVRILALRDSVFIFKDDGEVYQLTGEDILSFSVRLFDSTVRLYAPKTAVVFNNQIMTFSDQGVVSVSDSGVAVKSWDIENSLFQFLSPSEYPDFYRNAYGIAYESDRKYMLCDRTQAFVYNSFTGTWTRWVRTDTAGIVKSSTDKLYLAGADGYIRQERKNFDQFDHADDSLTVTIVSSSGTTVTLTSTSGVSVGDVLRQGNRNAKVETVQSGGAITVDEAVLWQAGAATVNESIECTMEWLPLYQAMPGRIKQFTELTVFFRDMNKDFKIQYSNNTNVGTYTTETVEPSFSGSGWGSLPWGSGPWGGVASGSQEVRALVTPSMARCLWLIVRYVTERAFTKFSINGATIMYNPMQQIFKSTT